MKPSEKEERITTNEVDMNSLQDTYATGDWIIHVYYGLGQVKGVEKKILNGEKQSFLKVKTPNSLYWIPEANTENDRIRPLASNNQIEYALTLIRKPPKEMAKDHNLRKKEISQTRKNVSLYSNVRMIRDLHGRRVSSKLNLTEIDVLREMKDQFLSEWILVKDEDHEILSKKLTDALHTSNDNMPIEAE